MRETLAGTFTLVRLGLRRDRWLLPLWIAAFVLMAYSTAAASAGLFPSEVGRIEAATTLNSTASMVALFGRIYDPSSLGALAMIKYSAFMTAALAVLMVVITVRHTRQDEETGRIELLSSGRLGRNAPLAAALVISFGASVVLGLLTAAALIAGGLPAAGSLAFGLGWAATGIAFSSVAAVTAQISASSRSAIGLGVIVVAVAYALRAVGDLAEPGPSVFSWLSPIGWNQQVRAFAGDRWAVLLLPLALGILLIPVAIVLRAHRDLGTGLRQDRPGPARGRLSGVWGLAVRLQDRVFLAWAFAVVIFGLLIGSLADGVTDFLTSPNAQEFIQKLGGASALTDAFLAAQIAIMGILVSVYGVSAANHLRSEETSGHAEVILATAATRTKWATSHYVAALLGVAVLLLLTGLSVGVGAGFALHDSSQVARVTVAALAQIPAAWVVTSVVVLIFGWMPRLTYAAWGFLVAFVALGEFGVLWNAPQWLMDLSPFEHSPQLPVGMDSVAPVVWLTLAAAAVGVVGYLGWHHRDLAE